ncbi:hypothetical protein BHYA_0089g00300 [Botrytis hyacinthi]|uniref:2EXR domain-containing protein n=1 Tax=Botrytis hyacinthi TaxID=278943 RepID=A0A4Z1GSM4_9HELO|nr:hypothetical protein BHYA_0089g00300 [Botrytis hyacinthi]
MNTTAFSPYPFIDICLPFRYYILISNLSISLLKDMSPNTMSNTDAMTDGALDSLISGVEQLAICNLQQETNKSDSCTNEGKTTPATDIQQVASTLESFPESETSTSSDTISRETSCTFEPFPRLAIELRLVIWGLACSQERLLEMTTHPTDIFFDLGAPTPSVLFVNHESREEA